jgi:agmatine deiminase
VAAAGCAIGVADELDSVPILDLPDPGPAPLPAFMTERERQGKADGWDPRDAYPEYYGFTAPPSGSVVLPGEFEKASEVMLGWGNGAWQLEEFLVDLARAAAEESGVTVVVPGQGAASWVSAALAEGGVDMDAVELLVAQIDSVWMRDYGPLVVRGPGGQVVIDPRYYWGRWADDFFPTALAWHRSLPVSRPPIEMEGGNLLSDGAGRCVTTEALIAQNSHLGYTAADVRKILRDYFGCEVTAIVPPLFGEGTGHVDMLVHITGPGEVMVGRYTTAQDSVNAARLDTAASRLSAAGFWVTRVPMPRNDNRTVWRTYTNSLAVNDSVLVPVYGEDRSRENEALSRFAQAYPGREIVPIDADEIIYWSGAVHCVAMSVSP